MSKQERRIGIGVDVDGYTAIDPTQNVLNLVAAAIKRQDDLRELESEHIREMSELRAAHTREMRRSEAARLDAIRAVDVNAVQRAAEVQAAAATALAATVTASAEAMRTQQAAATAAQTQNQAVALEPITKAIEDLRRSQYEAQGQKTQVVETQAKSGLTASQVAIIVAVISLLILALLSATGIFIGYLTTRSS